MMKSKYTAATALLVWLLVTGWLATLVIAKPAVLRQAPSQEETAQMAELRAAIANNQRSLQLMASLVDSAPPGAAGLAVALPERIAPAGVVASDAGTASGGNAVTADVPVVAPPRLSVVLQADGQRSAIIDGQLVRVGSRLVDGSRVRAIGHDWVRVQFGGGASQTLRVRSIASQRDGQQ